MDQDIRWKQRFANYEKALGQLTNAIAQFGTNPLDIIKEGLIMAMDNKTSIKLFEQKQVRSIWDEEEEKWYFSIVDVVGVLTESPNPRKYWSVLKTRLKKEGSQLTNKL